ncbi:MAG TPA: hypothetical protein VNJ28_07515, partial [Candidatus Limnocylindrales bacterium]|nr:hypothetical protein [Candidatus Limnocylindrales bacterium]
TAGDLAEYAPLLAPDGRSVVVGRRRRDGTDLGYWRVTLPGVLPIEERRILPDGAPPLGSTALEGDGIDPGTGVTPWGGRGAFSSDGRWLLLARGAGELVLVDLAADPVAARSVGIVAAAPPAWSDRSLAFFVAGRRAGDSRTTLYRVPLAGEPEPLGPADWVAVGPTGALATLGRDADGDPSHVRFAATPLASPSRLTSAENLADRAPSFSPDGRTIVFFRVPADAPTRSAGIWLVDPVTRDLRQLTTDGAYPRWLP